RWGITPVGSPAGESLPWGPLWGITPARSPLGNHSRGVPSGESLPWGPLWGITPAGSPLGNHSRGVPSGENTPGVAKRKATATLTCVKRSTSRILTSHAGSLHRPDDLRATMAARRDGAPFDAALEARVREAVQEVVRLQAENGVDVVNDG